MELRHGCVLALAVFGCHRGVPVVPPEVDAWARHVMTLPIDDVCSERSDGYFCFVRPALFTPAVRRLEATISLQGLRGERYLDIDWGGGHVEAYGVIIGPSGWSHQADPEFGEHRIRDGVFSYDTRQ